MTFQIPKYPILSTFMKSQCTLKQLPKEINWIQIGNGVPPILRAQISLNAPANTLHLIFVSAQFLKLNKMFDLILTSKFTKKTSF